MHNSPDKLGNAYDLLAFETACQLVMMQLQQVQLQCTYLACLYVTLGAIQACLPKLVPQYKPGYVCQLPDQQPGRAAVACACTFHRQTQLLCRHTFNLGSAMCILCIQVCQRCSL
eukprot:GHRR01022511.1.p1 GENE.GHRR01022511.1~~GHRR01022511.1.p1  ORF type:complete len:115 (+),score=12.75 GHRR01022511.1:1196-1540(+)